MNPKAPESNTQGVGVLNALRLGFVSAVGVALIAGCGSSPNDSLLGGPGAHGGGGPAYAGPGSGGGSGGSGVTPGGGGTPSGGGSPGGGGTPTPTATGAKGYFETTVFPAISTSPGPDANGNPTPACTSCHATGMAGAPTFLAGASAAAAYSSIASGTPTQLIAVPANSLLLLHGAHTGPALTNAQTTIVQTWLAMEVTERNLQAAPVLTVTSEMAKFGKCMTLSDFTTPLNGNAKAASDVWKATATNQGNNFACQTCHNVGDGGFYANQDTTQMFNATQLRLDFLKKYVTGTVDAQGNFSGLQASSAIRTKVSLTQTCVNQAACHPKINLNPAPGQSQTLQAIDDFVAATLTKYNAKQCP